MKIRSAKSTILNNTVYVCYDVLIGEYWLTF